MCVCVCDIQMLLPEGIRRDNNKMYEEVEIPPNEPMPIGFEEKPVYISELDEVGAAVCVCALCFHVCELLLKLDTDVSEVRLGYRYSMYSLLWDYYHFIYPSL